MLSQEGDEAERMQRNGRLFFHSCLDSTRPCLYFFSVSLAHVFAKLARRALFF